MSIKNTVAVLSFAAGACLAYTALAPVTPSGRLDVPETIVTGDAPVVLTVPEVTITASAPRRVVQTPVENCTHRGYLGGESWTCAR